MSQRYIYGTGFILFSLLAIYFSQVSLFQPVFILLFSTLISMSVWEFHQISLAKGLKPHIPLSMALATWYCFAVALAAEYASLRFLPGISLVVTLIIFFTYYFRKAEAPFLNLGTTVFAFAYLVIPLSCMLSIAYFFADESKGISGDGRYWLVYLVIVTKITDVAALLIGKKFGKTPFAPFISPKKTWEGAIGGFAVAALASVLLTATFKMFGANFSLTMWQSVWLGCVMAALAEFGDLAESLLKRDGGIKDSNQLPGLGGALDMVDSLVFTAPFLYIYITATT